MAGFQFAETMSGTVEWVAQPGVKHPFRFEVSAHADSIAQHLRDGKAMLHGVVYAPPRADGADADGTITIRIFGQKIIRYELAFAADDGASLTLAGQKTLRWLHARETFTYLPADLLDADGNKVAHCETHFDLAHDWWKFLRSWRPA